MYTVISIYICHTTHHQVNRIYHPDTDIGIACTRGWRISTQPPRQHNPNQLVQQLGSNCFPKLRITSDPSGYRSSKAKDPAALISIAKAFIFLLNPPMLVSCVAIFLDLFQLAAKHHPTPSIDIKQMKDTKQGPGLRPKHSDVYVLKYNHLNAYGNLLDHSIPIMDYLSNTSYSSCISITIPKEL